MSATRLRCSPSPPDCTRAVAAHPRDACHASALDVCGVALAWQGDDRFRAKGPTLLDARRSPIPGTRRRSMRPILALLVALLLAGPAHAATRPVGAKPLTDKRRGRQGQALDLGTPPRERRREPPRPHPNQLKTFRRKSDMPYESRVTGKFKGTTDEIIQWAAYKHGIDVDVDARGRRWSSRGGGCRTVGDNGDSFGLYQLRRPFHCCPAYAKRIDRVQRRLLRRDHPRYSTARCRGSTTQRAATGRPRQPGPGSRPLAHAPRTSTSSA